MAVLSITSAKVTGVKPTYVAATATGDEVPGVERAALLVKNGGTAAITVSVLVPGKTQFEQDQPDVPVSIPAGEERLIGPMARGLVNPDTNTVQFTYSAVTSVTIAAIAV